MLRITPLRCLIRAALMAAAFLACASRNSTVNAQDWLKSSCLHSVTAGPEQSPVAPCGNGDPAKLANNPDIQKVMSAFGIRAGNVGFKGCKNVGFSVAPDSVATSRYVVTYGIDPSGFYLAQITHEFAHILQIETAGGLSPLRKAFPSSKQIELGADFLTGIVFSQLFQNIALTKFDNGLTSMGLYKELDWDAHGTPKQRTTAFRRGVYYKFDAVNRDFRKASDDFMRNIYGEILQF